MCVYLICSVNEMLIVVIVVLCLNVIFWGHKKSVVLDFSLSELSEIITTIADVVLF